MVRKIGIAVGICIAAFLALAAAWPLFTRPVSRETLIRAGVIEPDSAFTDVGGVKTRYVAKGAGEESIILIHGFSSSLFTWRACLDTLAGQYRVYALDLKGFGFSDKPDTEYSMDEYVDFVAAFMEEMNVPSAVLCGNSMGGNIAWRTALKYPARVTKLILVDASGYPSDHSGIPFFVRLGRLPGAEAFFGALTTKKRIRESLESAYFDNAKVAEKTVDTYYYAMKTEGAMNAVLARLRSSSEETEIWQKKIASLDVPTLIVWGDKDTWVPLENAHQFHQDIAGSKLVILPGCGHLPQEEFPKEFSAHVLDFLAGRSDSLLTGHAPAQNAPLEGSHGLTVKRRQCYHRIG